MAGLSASSWLSKPMTEAVIECTGLSFGEVGFVRGLGARRSGATIVLFNVHCKADNKSYLCDIVHKAPSSVRFVICLQFNFCQSATFRTESRLHPREGNASCRAPLGYPQDYGGIHHESPVSPSMHKCRMIRRTRCHRGF